MRRYAILLVVAGLTLAGCAGGRTGLYHWGGYEQQLYNLYSDPGKVPFEQQLIGLEADYQRARSADRSVPPGYHAHVGYLYFQLGKMDQALQSFETEKALFPESRVYMDLLISRLKR